jgi:Ca2+-binding EF-hand superfamily protein
MASHRFLIILFAALPLLAPTASAQDARQYRAWDRNNDGVITRAEWRGPVQEFRERDWNSDGVLSGNEVWNDAWESGSQDTPDMNTFTSLDRNRNGRLSRGEWRGVRETFVRVDRNRDNQISREEFLNANAGYAADEVTNFDALDIDYSERVERDEWKGTRPAFNRLDTNRDGALTRRELASGDVRMAVADDFSVLDNNNDSVISRREWQPTYGAFTRHDVNRDGVISRDEFGSVDDVAAVENTIVVDSRQAWTDTGIHLEAGDVVIFRAAGTIQMSTDADDRATAAGAFSGRTAKNSPRPDQKAGGLLLRVGNGPVAFLGEDGSFTAQQSGRVYLGVNDDHLPDNRGEYRVSLSITPR